MSGRVFTRVDGTAYDPTQWVPGAVVKPVMKLVETLFGEETSRTEIEIAAE